MNGYATQKDMDEAYAEYQKVPGYAELLSHIPPACDRHLMLKLLRVFFDGGHIAGETFMLLKLLEPTKMTSEKPS